MSHTCGECRWRVLSFILVFIVAHNCLQYRERKCFELATSPSNSHTTQLAVLWRTRTTPHLVHLSSAEIKIYRHACRPADMRVQRVQLSFCVGKLSAKIASGTTSLPLRDEQPPGTCCKHPGLRRPVQRVANDGRKYPCVIDLCTLAANASLISTWTSSCELGVREGTWKVEGGACVAMTTTQLTVQQ